MKKRSAEDNLPTRRHGAEMSARGQELSLNCDAFLAKGKNERAMA
ncbi:MAG: hypothetical protein ABIO96_12850 [Nitrospiraceae bacterium]